MADNDIALSGQASSTKQGSGSAASKGMPMIGIVKDNIDPTRAGIIQVQLEGSTNPGSGSKDSGGWVKAQYLSTYFGAVKPTSGDSGTGSYKGNPSSYGQWQSPPDIGTKVVCIFINGDPTRCYYIGAVVEPEMLQMVPAIGASDKVTLNEGEAAGFGGATRLPVTNINTNDKKTADSAGFNDQPRPVHSYTASIMSQQGIIRDPIRGPISSSASREPASRVGWGVSTPGRPIYNGGYDDTNLPNNLDQKKAEQLTVVARRGGHSIVMDDGDIIGRDQLIRIRTALGHQILMSDDGQTMMLLHSNGQSYVELGKEGTVDIYSSNSFNVRTQGDINLHADQHINIHAMENLNIQAKNIHVNSEEISKFRAGTDFQVNALSNFMAKAGSAVAMAAGGEASLVAGASAYVNGSKVNLNSGSPGTSPVDVPIITLLAQTDTLFEQEKGWAAAPGKLLTITSRVPAHAPWANAGQGISIKTSAGASDSLPPAPSTAVQQTNQASQTAGTTPPAVATVASVPSSGSVSSSVDTGTTAAVLAATATSAANSATSAATQQGAAIVQAASAAGGTTATVAAGSFGQTATQLVSSGVIKPGADTLINGLASSGANVASAVPDSLFTGAPGAENLQSLVTNVSAQSSSMVGTMQQAQTALVTSGVLTGREASVQTAGIVTAAATSGINNTINTIQDISSSVNAINVALPNVPSTSAITAPVNSAINQFQGVASTVSSLASTANGVLGAIGAGSAAAGLASTLGGLGGIANSMNALAGGLNKLSLSSIVGSVQGVAADAFNTIKNAFPILKANVPQYLTQTAKDLAAATAEIGSKPAGQTNITAPLSTIANNVTNITSAVAGGLDTVENTVAGIAGTANTISTSINNVESIRTSITGTTVNTIGTMPASTNFASGLANVASTVTNIAGSGAEITNLISTATQASSAVNNAVSQVSGMAGATQAIMSGGIPELASAAKAVQSGGSAARAAALASGLSNLPGGASAAATVVDNAKTSIHIPGASALTGSISDIQTAVQSGLGSISGLSNSLTSISGAAGQLTTSLGDAANKLNGLTSSITSALNSSDASSLLASLSSLGAGGPSPVKIPEIGFNTFARGELSAQVTTLLNDPGIPQPNLIGDISPETEETLNQTVTETYKKIEDIQAKIDELDPQLTVARNEYFQASNSLPAGDPGIDAAKSKYDALIKQMNALVVKMDEFLYEDTSNGQGLTQAPINSGPTTLA